MIRRLLQPAPELLRDPSPRSIGATAAITVISLAIYGFTVGFWRSPVMGAYVAIKMPLMVMCTLACNAALNGMLGMLLGGLGLRQSCLALLSGFSVSALILASLAPVTFFMALEFPDSHSPQAVTAHAVNELFHVVLIAAAGVAGALSLHRILVMQCGSPRVARATMLCWLAGNGLLGAQFSWIFRPFFATPSIDEAFLREHPMQGSFYESVWKAGRRVSAGHDDTIIIVIISGSIVAALLWILLRRLPRSLNKTSHIP